MEGPQISWNVQPQTLEDELEEELYFIEKNMSCLKKKKKKKPYYHEMELRKKRN